MVSQPSTCYGGKSSNAAQVATMPFGILYILTRNENDKRKNLSNFNHLDGR